MKTIYRFTHLSLLLVLLLMFNSVITQSETINAAPAKFKFAFFSFNNDTPAYNSWLAKGIPFLIAHHLEQIPDFQIIRQEEISRSGLSENSVSEDNAMRICQSIQADYLIYGNFSSSGSHDAENATIKIRFIIASKQSSKVFSSQLTTAFPDITRLTSAISYTINEKTTGNSHYREMLETPSIHTAESFVHLFKGFQNYEKGDYSEAIIQMRKAILSSGRYLDRAVKTLSLSYQRLLERAKKTGNSIKLKIQTPSGEKTLKLEYKELKKRYLEIMQRYAGYSTPAEYHLGHAYYQTVETDAAIHTWKRLIQTLDRGGSVLHWTKSFAARPSTVSTDNSAVYVGTQTGTLFALDKFTGRTLWYSPVVQPIQVEPYIHKDQIAVITGGYPSTLTRFLLYAKESGSQTWSYMTAGEPAGTPVSIGDIIIAGTATGSGELIAIDARQKRIVWRRKSFFPRSMVSDGKFAYVLFRQYIKNGSEIKNAESVSAIDPFTGAIRWTYTIERNSLPPDHNPNTRHIGIHDDAIYFASGSRLFILNKSNGSLLKKTLFPELITFVYPTSELVYIGMAEKTIAYHPENGEIAFSFNANGIITYPEIQNETLFFGTSDRTLYALNKSNGAYRFHFSAHGEIYFPPRAEKKLIFLSSYDGNVYCIEGGKHVFHYGTPRKEIFYSLGLALLQTGKVEEAAKYFALM